MRENRTHGLEGGEVSSLLYPYLLLILSPEFRESIRNDVLAFYDRATRCAWLVPILKDDSFAAILAIHSFKEEAISHGDKEIQSAKKLEEEISKIESEYQEVLTLNSPFLKDIAGLRISVKENRAIEALKQTLPSLRKAIFDASRSLKVGKSFRSMNKRLWLELLADGLFVSCLIVGVRMWMGHSLADDSFGGISARISPILENLGQTKPYLFAALGALAMVWVGLGATTRRLAKRFFGDK